MHMLPRVHCHQLQFRGLILCLQEKAARCSYELSELTDRLHQHIIDASRENEEQRKSKAAPMTRISSTLEARSSSFPRTLGFLAKLQRSPEKKLTGKVTPQTPILEAVFVPPSPRKKPSPLVSNETTHKASMLKDVQELTSCAFARWSRHMEHKRHVRAEQPQRSRLALRRVPSEPTKHHEKDEKHLTLG